MELEPIAWGYKLVEGPRTDADGNLYFTDAMGGGVYLRTADGEVSTLVEKRKMVGGLALHKDGGFVMTGPNVAHWKDGEVRVLLEREGVNSFNDLHTDAQGRVYVGAIRSSLDDLKAEKIPYRVSDAGGNIEVASGRVYETPVGPFATDDGFVIALPYGTSSDWVKNVLAAGSATLVTEGRRYDVEQPEIVPLGAVADVLPSKERRNLRLFRVELALRARRREVGSP